MRLLFATIAYPPSIGGSQSYVQRLSESLAADGHRVTVCTTNAGEVESIWDGRKASLAAGETLVNGVTVRRFPIRYVPPSPYAYYATRRAMALLDRGPNLTTAALWSLAGFTPWVPELGRAMTQDPGGYDVVHGFTIPFESVLRPAARLAGRTRTPFLVTPFLHAGEQDGQVARGYSMRHQIELMKGAAGVIAMSGIEREFLVGRGLDPTKVQAIPAGVPLDEEGSPPEDRCEASASVLFLGAVTYDKGAVHLAEAARKLWARGANVDLTFAGTVTDGFRRYWKALPDGDRARLRVLGPVSEDEKLLQLRRCTLLAMPSRVDSFGLAFLEAWAQGKPVIGARAGGVPAVVDDGVNGLLVPFGDVEALASAVARLVERPQDARRMGGAGREKLRRCYSWDSTYARLLGLYQEVLAR